MTEFARKLHDVDFCVVGGGMAGLCAAIAAARHGLKTVLMHDRPVFGGNASSECRVHICGADIHNHVKNMRETGILEELRMENLYRNPNRNFSIFRLQSSDILMPVSSKVKMTAKSRYPVMVFLSIALSNCSI